MTTGVTIRCYDAQKRLLRTVDGEYEGDDATDAMAARSNAGSGRESTERRRPPARNTGPGRRSRPVCATTLRPLRQDGTSEVRAPGALTAKKSPDRLEAFPRRHASKPAPRESGGRAEDVMKRLVGLLHRSVHRCSAATGVRPDPAQSEPFGLSGLRIAFFSPQRAFSDSDDGKAGLARLKALDEKRGREVEARTTELRKREEALKASLGMLSADGRSPADPGDRKVPAGRRPVHRGCAGRVPGGPPRGIEDAFLVRVEADPRAGGEGSRSWNRDPERRRRDAALGQIGQSISRARSSSSLRSCR